MSQFRKKFASSAMMTGGARLVEVAAIFCRNLILANLLGPANQGVAATFAIVMSFLDMLSDLGSGRLLVQDSEGDSEKFQASLQSMEILRGCVVGSALFLGAPLFAAFFNTPQAEWAFRMLALAPLIRGFQHLDTSRFQRQMKFGRYIATSVVPQIFCTIAAYPLALYLGDYSAVLYIILFQSSLSLALSHSLAERKYRLGITAEHLYKIFIFSGPLLLNSVLLFATLQGDRTIVGRFYDPVALGIYATAIGLATTASGAVMSIITPLSLPTLSMVKEDNEQFAKRYFKLNDISLPCSMSIALGFILLGPSLVRTVYTDEFAAATTFIGALGVSAALRTLRIVPNAAQLARGDTMGIFLCNIFRLTGVVLALYFAAHQWTLSAIAWSGVFGELCALFATFFFIKIRQGLPTTRLVYTILVFSAGVASALLIRIAIDRYSINLFFQWAGGVILVCFLTALAAFSSRTVREEIRSVLKV